MTELGAYPNEATFVAIDVAMQAFDVHALCVNLASYTPRMR